GEDIRRDVGLVILSRHFDFNAATSPTAQGYIGVTPSTRYSATLGHGWVGDVPTGFDSPGFLDVQTPALTALLRDGQNATNHTFPADLPDGRYRVNMTVGGPGARGATGLSAAVTGGAALVADPTNQPLTRLGASAQPYTLAFVVDVTGGNLQLQFTAPAGS